VCDGDDANAIRQTLVENQIRKATNAIEAIPRRSILNTDEIVSFDSSQRTEHFREQFIAEAWSTFGVPAPRFSQLGLSL
jgi:hypothetical protein